MMLSLIVAMANNRVIGKDGALPWHLPEDLRWFREQTLGHYLLMGRRTFEGIGVPLIGRQTIVVSRNPDFQAPRCRVAGDIASALALVPADARLFVCGGAQIYRQLLPLAERLYLTRIKLDVDGDTRFPEFDAEAFTTIYTKPGEGDIPHCYTILQRRHQNSTALSPDQE